MTANNALPAADARWVLVVDDDSAVRMMVARALESSGYAVVEARDGAEALELLEDKKIGFGLVLTDIHMPKLGGLELGREVAARQWQIPVLYMSADPPAGSWTGTGSRGRLVSRSHSRSTPLSPAYGDC